MNIKDKLVTDQKLMPFEKYELMGPESLSDAELIALIIRSGTRERSAVRLAEDVLSAGDETESGEGLFRLPLLSLADLMSVRGIGKVKAIQIQCICEISRRIWNKQALRRLTINKPSTVADLYMEDMRHYNMEQVRILLLDTRNRLLKSVIISQGTVNCSAVSPREIFSEAIRYRAASFILVHNHPSGSCDPSNEDISFSRTLKEISIKMNISLRDSIIIGDKDYFSFTENNMF